MINDIVRHTDAEGRAVVGVKLTNADGRAWLDAGDYEAVVREVGPRAWFINCNSKGRRYVRVRSPHTGRNDTVARIITGRLFRAAVRQLDGDPLNLRQSNLEITFGCGGCPKRPHPAPRSPRQSPSGNTYARA